MIDIQNTKCVTLLDNAGVATNNSTYVYVDCSGYRTCTFIIGGDVADATNASATLTSCTFQGGNTTSLGTTIVTGTTSTSPGSSQFTLPINNLTAVYSTIVAHIRNDTGYKYIGALVVPSETDHNNYCVTAVLSEPTEGPPTYTYTAGQSGKSFIV